jgi:predicted anti-sigma-YlaC factor YlaD
MNCHEIQQITVPYLELDLDPARVHEVTTHLESCPNCREEMEAVRQVLVRLKGQTVPDPGEQFWAAFPSVVRRRLGDRVGGTERQRKSFVRAWRSASLRVWPLALAASVMIVAGTWFLTGGQWFHLDRGQVTVTHTTDLPDFVEADWDRIWAEEDPDLALADLAAGLDPGTVDRLFKDI